MLLAGKNEVGWLVSKSFACRKSWKGYDGLDIQAEDKKRRNQDLSTRDCFRREVRLPFVSTTSERAGGTEGQQRRWHPQREATLRLQEAVRRGELSAAPRRH